MARLEEIDVEQLLHRAYYERQVHRLGPLAAMRAGSAP